jgi:CubicO group peptidase (beta-lactamase class C family)
MKNIRVELLQELFEENFVGYDELGASVSIWHRGEPVFNTAGGYQDRAKQTPWTPQTRVLIWSSTKGLASACLVHACMINQIDLERKVTDFWPEFGQNGKESTTLLHILAHQAGLSALRDREIPFFDRDNVVHALAAQQPFWMPGQTHGYHARTYGFLLDEIIRRITGSHSIGDYFRQVFGEPLGLDLWIGLPETLVHDVAPIQAPRKTRASSDEDLFYAELAKSDSLSHQTFSTPAHIPTASGMNDAKIRTACLPSFGGIGTAEALAHFYMALPDIFDEKTFQSISTSISDGPDRVLMIDTAFSAGFMKDPVHSGRKLRSLFGPSLSAFGQPGAGGSHAFIDPENQIAFAYVMNQMEPGLFPNPKSLRLIEKLYADCLSL